MPYLRSMRPGNLARRTTGERKDMSYYAEAIREDAARAGRVGANVRHIEAWMRLEHGTLDALTRDRFRAEVRTALDCIDAVGDAQGEALAVSFGLGAR